MSFTDDVKHELAHFEIDDKILHQAEVSALIKLSGSILISSGQVSIKLAVYHGDVARRIYRYLKEEYKFKSEIRVTQNNLTKRKKYELYITPQKGVYELLENLGILNKSHSIMFTVADWIKNDRESKRAYLRGVFLAGGSVNKPKEQY